VIIVVTKRWVAQLGKMEARACSRGTIDERDRSSKVRCLSSGARPPHS
jgi:hypothetical protein